MWSRIFLEAFTRRKATAWIYRLTFQLLLAHLGGCFWILKPLQLKAARKQGCKHNVLCYYQSIYGMQTEMSNYLSFPTSSSLTKNDDHWQENAKNPIGLHLDCLADKFICYFPENCSGNIVHKLVCKSVPCWCWFTARRIARRSTQWKTEIKSGGRMKFQAWRNVWKKYFLIHPKDGEGEIHHSPVFFHGPTVCGKKWFSILFAIKNKNNRINFIHFPNLKFVSIRNCNLNLHIKFIFLLLYLY